MWYVYIVQCVDDTLYTGVTTDVSRREREHNNKKGCRYTRSRVPVIMRYTECCACKSDALKREAHIKRFSRLKKLKLINGQ